MGKTMSLAEYVYSLVQNRQTESDAFKTLLRIYGRERLLKLYGQEKESRRASREADKKSALICTETGGIWTAEQK